MIKILLDYYLKVSIIERIRFKSVLVICSSKEVLIVDEEFDNIIAPFYAKRMEVVRIGHCNCAGFVLSIHIVILGTMYTTVISCVESYTLQYINLTIFWPT